MKKEEITIVQNVEKILVLQQFWKNIFNVFMKDEEIITVQNVGRILVLLNIWRYTLNVSIKDEENTIAQNVANKKEQKCDSCENSGKKVWKWNAFSMNSY